MLHKLAFRHVRFWIAIATGVLIFFVLPSHWPVVSRVLAGWNCGAALFMILIYLWMTALSAEQISTRFNEEDESAPVLLLVVVAASLLSLIAIVLVLDTVRSLDSAARTAHIVLAALTLVNSWLLVATIFTLRYTDLFYAAGPDRRPLVFPQTPMPEFLDFAYFSFTIAAACQTSDVSTTGISIRKTVLAHTLVSFLFNAAILGFAINVSAGLLGGK